MSDRTLRLLLATLTTAVIAIAAYLVTTHYTNASPVCTTGGCHTVQNSAYADIFGIPVALIGLLGAVAILLTLVRGDLKGRAAGLALALTGALFAAYLITVQLAVLDTICEWCIANDTLLLLIAATAAWRARPDLAAHAPSTRGRGPTPR